MLKKKRLKKIKRKAAPSSLPKKKGDPCNTPDGGPYSSSQGIGAVNCCRKDLHPRRCRYPRFSSFLCKCNLTKCYLTSVSLLKITNETLLTKDRTFCIRWKTSFPISFKKETIVLHQYFLMVVRFFQLNLTYSIHVLTTFYPKKVKISSLYRDLIRNFVFFYPHFNFVSF